MFASNEFYLIKKTLRLARDSWFAPQSNIFDTCTIYARKIKTKTVGRLQKGQNSSTIKKTHTMWSIESNEKQSREHLAINPAKIVVYQTLAAAYWTRLVALIFMKFVSKHAQQNPNRNFLWFCNCNPNICEAKSW